MNDQVFLLPDLGEGLTEADILEWRVAIGDTVHIDQIVAEVETAKAAVEVPVPFAGTVIELHAAAGDTVRVGSPLIAIRAADGGGTSPADAGQHAAYERYRNEERAGSGNVLIGYGTGHDVMRRRRRARQTGAPTARPAVRAESGAASAASEDATTASSPAPVSGVVSPLVRDLARRTGIDLATVAGTGPSGIITRADVERAGIAAPATVDSRPPDVDRIPLKGLRKVIADKLTTSRREIPDATTWVDVDATELLRARSAINEVLPDDERISLLALLARLTLSALAHYPELNASVDSERGEIVRHRHVHLGVAAQTPRGLVVPVIARADSLTTVELARDLRETVETARTGKLPPARLIGGTFTLNNYGVFGVDGSTPIINHPEAAILGVGRIVDKPWVVDGQLAIRKLTQISLSFDHRVCDGGTAGGFLRLFGDYLENPVATLGRL